MKYDLLIRDGEVLDPAAGLKGRLDVAISAGKIAAVAPSLPENDARRTISARGLLVTPGLIDIHAHIFVNAYDMGGHTDRFCQASGVTTLCDAGSTGSATFAGLRQIIDGHVRTRTRAFVNLSAIGIVGTSRGGELSHFPYADPEGCARTIAENPDLAIGVKLRYGPNLVWEYTTKPVKMARRTAAMAGVPMMIHITDSPIPLPEILAEMAPGDIVTHCYHGRANGIMGQEKEFVLKEVVEAQRHGIVFDCAHGRNHFSFRMIEKALDQGFLPDTISTDLTFTSATRGPVWDLTTTMSKLLHFGMSLDDLVARATAAPAKIMGYEGTVGTLRPGANADIALLELRNGNFEMTDSDGNTVTAKRRLIARTTLKDGRVWYERPAE
jgi:dihydroorotase